MNRDQAREIVKIVAVAYPKYFRNDLLTTTVDVWFEALEDARFEDVMKNVKGYLKENKFPPSIADVRPTKQLNGVMSAEQTKVYLDKLEREREEMAQGEKLDFPRDYKAFKKFMEERKGEE
jgi:hypothetical protein